MQLAIHHITCTNSSDGADEGASESVDSTHEGTSEPVAESTTD